MEWLLATTVFVVFWFGIVWLAVAVCAAKDRLSGYHPDKENSKPIDGESFARKYNSLPLWKRAIGALLFVLMLPTLVVFLIPVFVIAAIPMFSYWAYFRLRFALFGIPIPVVEVPEPPNGTA